MNGVADLPTYQGCSSTKIVGGQGLKNNVGRHGLPTKKLLGFEWAKATIMVLKFLRFSGTFLNMFRIFLVGQNNFCESSTFSKGIFS